MELDTILTQPPDYIPITNLRERALTAYEAERESAAAERAEQLARATRNLRDALIRTAWEMLHVRIQPESVSDDIEWAGTDARIVVWAVVDHVRLELVRALRDITPGVGAMATVDACALCPVCGDAYAGTVVTRLADLGWLLGERGCERCGWMPDAVDGEVTA